MVNLRLDHSAAWANLYTLWFEDLTGRNSVVTRNGRLRWVGDEPSARLLVDELPGLVVDEEEPALFDVIQVRNDLTYQTSGSEMRVLNCLSFLDDLILQQEVAIPDGHISTMDQIIFRLTVGESLNELYDAVGGVSKVVELLDWQIERVVSASFLD